VSIQALDRQFRKRLRDQLQQQRGQKHRRMGEMNSAAPVSVNPREDLFDFVRRWQAQFHFHPWLRNYLQESRDRWKQHPAEKGKWVYAGRIDRPTTGCDAQGYIHHRRRRTPAQDPRDATAAALREGYSPVYQRPDPKEPPIDIYVQFPPEIERGNEKSVASYRSFDNRMHVHLKELPLDVRRKMKSLAVYPSFLRLRRRHRHGVEVGGFAHDEYAISRILWSNIAAQNATVLSNRLVHDELERLGKAAAPIQGCVRGVLLRCQLKHRRNAVTTIQACVRGVLVRCEKKRRAQAATTIQGRARGVLERHLNAAD